MMKKFAEDDRIEQMNQQKWRMKELEHKKEVERLWQEKLEMYKEVEKICAESEEIKALWEKINNAYLNKERIGQMAEKQYRQ